MPLVRIDVEQRRTEAELQNIADAIHSAIVSVYRIPERDRFQVLSRLPESRIIAQDAGLGFERSSKGAVIIQIFTQRGRSKELKQELYAAICDSLVAVDVAESDVFIGYVENGPEDWSFGFGRAQYVTGELSVPKASLVDLED